MVKGYCYPESGERNEVPRPGRPLKHLLNPITRALCLRLDSCEVCPEIQNKPIACTQRLLLLTTRFVLQG